MMQKIFAGLLLLFLLPLFLLISLTIFSFSDRPILFIQERWGYKKKPFFIYKFRTMYFGAEKDKGKYSHMNQADGPVFKIRDDPRYTKIGNIISHLGLDELPQLLNIMKGDMVFIGPRPLPKDEAEKIPKKYEKRFTVLPGVTSLWVIRGGHKLSFQKWMELDLLYVTKKSMILDIEIIFKTISMFLRVVSRYL